MSSNSTRALKHARNTGRNYAQAGESSNDNPFEFEPHRRAFLFGYYEELDQQTRSHSDLDIAVNNYLNDPAFVLAVKDIMDGEK